MNSQFISTNLITRMKQSQEMKSSFVTDTQDYIAVIQFSPFTNRQEIINAFVKRTRKGFTLSVMISLNMEHFTPDERCDLVELMGTNSQIRDKLIVTSNFSRLPKEATEQDIVACLQILITTTMTPYREKFNQLAKPL